MPKMFLASISPLLASIPVWGLFDIFSTLLVLIGVCGEWSWLMRVLISERPNDLLPVELKRKKLEKRLLVVLIIGVAGELACIPFSLWESSTLNNEAADARRIAGEANERASTNELAAKQLEIQLNATKTQLANAEARLNQSVIDLQNANLPISIGDQLGLGAALKQLPEMRVELRNVMDLKAQTAADALLFVFGLAGWPIINRAVIGDIGSEGIVIGYNNGDESSKNAAYSLLKLLTDRNVPSEVIDDPYGDRVRGVPTNAIIVAVCSRPSKTMANIMLAQAKDKGLRDQEATIWPKIAELMSQRFVPGSKELSAAQSEYIRLNLQNEEIHSQRAALSQQLINLYDQLSQEDVITNSSSSFSGSGIFMGGHMVLSNAVNFKMSGNRFTVPLQ